MNSLLLNMSPMNASADSPEVTTAPSDITKESIIASASQLDPDHSARLTAAKCVIVPEPGRGDYDGPLFFGTTPDLLRAMDEAGFPTEVPVRDEDYTELALHADTTWLGILWVHREDALALVKLLAGWLRSTLGEYAASRHADLTLVVQDGEKSKAIKYKGPADQFSTLVTNAVEALNSLGEEK